MELKDVVLSTIAEIDNISAINIQEKPNQDLVLKNNIQIKKLEPTLDINPEILPMSNEKDFLKDIKAKLTVLFEGLKNPKTKEINKKLELTLEYLEYQLAVIENRLAT